MMKIFSFSKWQDIKFRLENTALRDILFGSFTAITSAFFYRYTSTSNISQASANLVNFDMVLVSAFSLVMAASFRYIGHFIFIFSCPTLIQAHKDIDELLKKSKDSLPDADDWVEVHRQQINKWNDDNYRYPFWRILVWATEICSFLSFLIGIYFLYEAVRLFVLRMLHLF